MKKEDSFLSTLRIAMFDFKKYTVFLGMKPSKVILNRFIFVLLISVFYFMSSRQECIKAVTCQPTPAMKFSSLLSQSLLSITLNGLQRQSLL